MLSIHADNQAQVMDLLADYLPVAVRHKLQWRRPRNSRQPSFPCFDGKPVLAMSVYCEMGRHGFEAKVSRMVLWDTPFPIIAGSNRDTPIAEFEGE